MRSTWYWHGAAAAVCVAAGLLWYARTCAPWFQRAIVGVGDAYGAHLACTVEFGTPRSGVAALRRAEFVWPPIGFAREFHVDRTARCVTARGGSGDGVRYCWRSHRLGCARAAGVAAEAEANADAVTSADADDNNAISGEADTTAAEPWPNGDAPDSSRVRSALEDGMVDLQCLERVADSHFSDRGRFLSLHSRALLVLRRGEIVYERYGDGFNASTRLHGWSMTKSLLNAVMGARIAEGGFGPNGLDTRLGDVMSSGGGDDGDGEKRVAQFYELTLRQLLQMRDGSDLDEKYVPGSGVVEMLFESPALMGFGQNVAPRRAGGNGCFQYNSFTSNLLSAALKSSFLSPATDGSGSGGGSGGGSYLDFPTRALFNKIGMRSALVETDTEDVFIMSSFGWATARDWARLGLLYMWNGVWKRHDGKEQRVLPPWWVNFTREVVPTSRGSYGAHFWLGGNQTDRDPADEAKASACDAVFPARAGNAHPNLGFPRGSLLMRGFEGQMVVVSPEHELVVVRLGATKVGLVQWDQEGFFRALFGCVGVNT